MLYPYGYWGHDAKTSFWSKLDPNALDKIVENTKGILRELFPVTKEAHMRVGFAKSDITPRVGVELAGFGPYIHRYSIGVRDRLWARAMAIEQQNEFFALISCDLVGLNRDIIQSIQNLLSPEGFRSTHVMVCCSHTHSGPATGRSIGWEICYGRRIDCILQR